VLSTERLLLRRWRPDDLGPYADICADAEVMRWIGSGRVRTREECAEAISAFERAWDARGFGLFAMELQATGRLIGFVGLAVPEFLPEILPSVEIGWRLAADQWGKGLATEGALAALHFGFGHVGLTRLVSIHQIGNDASGRIMEKLGMRFERETVDPSCGRPVRVWEIARSDWERPDVPARSPKRESTDDPRRGPVSLRDERRSRPDRQERGGND
jgi:RimJ/RimL family protein N-acetyltransferase